MQPIPHIRTQVGLLLAADGIAVAVRGDPIALASVVIIGLGATVTVVFALAYHWRRHARAGEGHPISAFRQRDDKRMVALSALGYGAPLGVAVAMVVGLHIHGLLFHSEAATVAALLPIATFTAVLTSSEVDWYFITPYQRGVLNPPICNLSTGGSEDPDIQKRRAYAKWWVAQRGICELVSYTSVAVFLAIVGAALTEDVKADNTLQIALGSFVGAGTAFWLAAYVQGRLVAAWQFMQEQSVGLGRWADGVNTRDADIEGFVRDVSITPGIQLCPDPEKKPEFVPLKYAPTTQDRDLPKTLCSKKCELWVELCDHHFRQQEAAAETARSPSEASSPA
jgi:hypothetical protein